MPSVSSASTQPKEWKIREKDIKSYLHFDRRVSPSQLERYVQDNEKVSKHPFFPLILFNESWVKFRKDGSKKIKKRPLRYAARKDAAIFAYHRHCISESYESELLRRNISEIPVAYRKIQRAKGGNKCNIDFAKDVFDYIKKIGDCDVTVVDVSSFFESLDHENLRNSWESIIKRPLNDAENAVFNAVTKYTVVSRDRVFERLSLFDKSGGVNRKERRQRNLDKIRKRKHLQICTSQEFREKVCGENPKFPSLLNKNAKNYGIPQGTPISDILANIYLIDFDARLARWVRKRGGRAFRYSDDIIVVLPRSASSSYCIAMDYLQGSIKNFGSELKIKDEKVSVSRFIKGADRIYYTHITGNSSRNGLEYLGFEFDGTKVQLRNSTLSNAWRKMKRRSYGWAKRWVRRHRAKGDQWMRDNAPIDDQTKKILRCVSVQERDFKKWTFNRYVTRCANTFVGYENKFSSQTKRYRKKTKEILHRSLDKAIRKYGYEACIEKGINL